MEKWSSLKHGAVFETADRFCESCEKYHDTANHSVSRPLILIRNTIWLPSELQG
jgi:hypothetical protein